MKHFAHIAYILGSVVKWFGVIFLIPATLALADGTAALPFFVPFAIAICVGTGLQRQFEDHELDRRDGFLFVIAVWGSVSVLGALPYLLNGTGTIAEPINAFFESVSGFTCTGATVLGEISADKHSRAIMLWRQLTQWLGGMGILALAVAILPRLSSGGAQFLDEEVPGPRVDRLTPHIADTARRLWLLYGGCTALLLSLLIILHHIGFAPSMDWFQATAHALTTLPSGGFSPQPRSVEAFSPAVQWVIIPFMLVAAMNFALLWRAIFERPGLLGENAEFKVYGILFLLVGVFVGVGLLAMTEHSTIEASMRTGFFQTATILTTTGYASADFALWPQRLLVPLFLLMFVSGCLGSTSGGIKMMRWLVAVKVLFRELLQRVHPSAVRPLRAGRRILKESVVRGSILFIVTYLMLFAVSWLVLALDTTIAGEEVTILEIASSVAATIGNIGPGFGRVGPMNSFEFYPVVSKLWMCFLMVAGRLEVMAFLVILTPTYWKS